MLTDTSGRARLTEVASFPPGHFLENLAVRTDGSILVTEILNRGLWYIPPFRGGSPSDPICLHTFDLGAFGIVEAETDVFYVCTSTVARGELHRLDLRRWQPGAPVVPERVVVWPDSVGVLNGSCFVAPHVLLVADSFTRSIWRVDRATDGTCEAPRRWLEHESMAHDPDGAMPGQPGVNGVRFAARTGTLYYTSTAQQLFMRVPVDPRTHDPAGEPQRVAHGMMGDDFCIDEDREVAYVTTHRQNTLDRVSLVPGQNETGRVSVVGEPVVELLVGPSSVAWGRDPGEHGRVAYVTTDGGLMAPLPDGRVRPARVVRVEL